MRDIKVERDREWLIIVTTRYYRSGREPKITRTYLSMDEAAIVAGLLAAELPPVTSVP